MAGLPERVVKRAEQLLQELERDPVRLASDVRVQEGEPTYSTGAHVPDHAPMSSPSGNGATDPETQAPSQVLADEQAIHRVVAAILAQDLVNTTPLQALLLLYELQQSLRDAS